MTGTNDKRAAEVFGFFIEIGIISQLACTLLAKTLPRSGLIALDLT